MEQFSNILSFKGKHVLNNLHQYFDSYQLLEFYFREKHFRTISAKFIPDNPLAHGIDLGYRVLGDPL